MKYCFSLAIIIMLSCVSCKKDPVAKDTQLITIDEKQKKESVVLSEFADIEVIPLEMPKSILFGEVQHIKVSQNYLAVFDEIQTKSVTLFNHKGKFVNQLQKVGQGPGEYTDITDFTFTPKEDELLAYDRNSGNIRMYSLPDLNFQRKVKTHIYLMVINAIENSFLAVSDEDVTENTEVGVGYVKIDNSEKSFKFSPISILPNNIGIVEMSSPWTFSRNAKGLVYAMNTLYPVIYQIRDKEVTPLATVDFGENKIPEKYWGMTEFLDFREALSTPPLKSLLVHNAIVTNKYISFCYVFGNIEHRQLAIYDREKRQTTVIRKILLGKDCGSLPYALGVADDSFLTLLYPDAYDEFFPNGLPDNAPQWLKEVEQMLQSDKIICLKYKIK